METEYIIISKTAIQQRIDDLKTTDTASWEYQLGQINTLNEVLSQSTPLIPEIEKAFGLGAANNANGQPLLSDYISNLKLDI